MEVAYSLHCAHDLNTTTFSFFDRIWKCNQFSASTSLILLFTDQVAALAVRDR